MTNRFKDQLDPIEENIEKVILAFRSARKRMLDILRNQKVQED